MHFLKTFFHSIVYSHIVAMYKDLLFDVQSLPDISERVVRCFPLSLSLSAVSMTKVELFMLPLSPSRPHLVSHNKAPLPSLLPSCPPPTSFCLFALYYYVGGRSSLCLKLLHSSHLRGLLNKAHTSAREPRSIVEPRLPPGV